MSKQGQTVESVKSTIRSIETKLNDHQSQTPINNLPAVRGKHGSHFEGGKKK